jgi:Fe-S cluster biogenesis protein NfuA
MNQKDVVPQYGGACSGCAYPKVELMAGSAALMRIMMAELAEIISADSIFAKTHLYLGE